MYFSSDYIQLKIDARDWQESLRLAAVPLLKHGDIDKTYIDHMIDAVKTLGPYIVIAPGLALGHARPDKSVRNTAIAIATLDHPVDFGSSANDPVDIIVVLAAKDNNSHIVLLQKIVALLNQEHGFELIRGAQTQTDKEKIAQLLNE